ncbi:MAG TPA: hypothetical protein VM074_05450 [Solimonas sp.]|nr:hypothetical protein [Solimonas sp.]
MSRSQRRNHYDVTNAVRISDPSAVCDAVFTILEKLFPAAHLGPVRDGFDTFTRLFAGTLPGYVGCDTWYHDAQHSLDCTLAMARLLDGHERTCPAGERLGERRAMLGILIALFHDAGYIRRLDDAAMNGAEFTLNHVRRSGEFLADYLPTIGFADEVELTRQVVHYTGYEIALDQIKVEDPKDRMLGFLLGTADVIAQTSDRCYLEKCRDYLYREFEYCGLAGRPRPCGPKVIYASARDLLEKTPEFNRKLWEERLDGYFGSVYRYMEPHFGGRNPYVEQIRAHLARVVKLIKSRRLGELRLKPQVVGARELRKLLGIQPPRVQLAPKTARKARPDLRHAA